jgi:two-component system sensor histidine kinase KdpD
VIVAIDGRGQSEYLVRVARRMAERRDAPWTVVSVQTGAHVGAGLPARREIDEAFALARRLGGDYADPAARFAMSWMRNARAYARTQRRVSTRSCSGVRVNVRFARIFNRTLTQQLILRGAHLEITIISTPEARARARRNLRETIATTPREAGIAVGGSVIAVAVAGIAERWLGLTDLSMVFIIAVTLVASRTRMSAAVVAAVLCFFAYNFFFIEPRFTFYIGARQGVATVLLFLVAALVAGRLASRLRAQVNALSAAHAHATALQSLGQKLASAADLGQVIQAGREGLALALSADAIVHLGDTPLDHEHQLGVDEKGRAAADWARKNRQPAGRFTDTLAGSALVAVAACGQEHWRHCLALPAHGVAARARTASSGRGDGRGHCPVSAAHAAGCRP